MIMRVCGFSMASTLIALGMASGCAVVGHERLDGPKYIDARQPSDFDTPNLESSDVQTACEMAVSRLLASDLLSRVNRTPVFLVEDDHFVNDGQGLFDTKALVDLFRNELVNAGQGRVRVLRPTAPEKPVTADFVVEGRVTDVVNTQESVAEAYTQISFNVVLANTGEVVFSDLYSVKKGASLTPHLY